MKKLILVLTLVVAMTQAQENKLVPQITVSGEGKIKVIPDEAIITVGVENSGKDAVEVKKKNDETIDAVIKIIKKNGIPLTDFQSQRISLFKSYDFETKKSNYMANQSIVIHLKDLKKYESLMVDIVNSGVNQIQGVQFKTSKLDQYETEARKKAVLQAKKKAEDYVVALDKKIGKAILVSDASQSNYPQPMYANMMVKEMSADSVNQTLAIGEIEVEANVTITFLIE